MEIMNHWKNHIEANPKILFGKPVIKGTRIAVDVILEKLGNNYSTDDLLQAYPHITIKDIYACLLFAANRIKTENVEEIA